MRSCQVIHVDMGFRKAIRVSLEEEGRDSSGCARLS